MSLMVETYSPRIAKHVIPSPNERFKLAQLKANQARVEAATLSRLKGDEYGDLFGRCDPRGATIKSDGIHGRTLDEVKLVHDRDVEYVICRLSREFPGEEIHILDEGASGSTFFHEIAEAMEKRNIKVHVTRTDLDPKRMLCHGDLDNQSPAFVASPEELFETFGAEAFHLVMSTFGGLAYTPISQIKGMANVFEILKPGGEAHIAAGDVPIYFTGCKDITPTMLEPLLSDYPEIKLMKTFISMALAKV